MVNLAGVTATGSYSVNKLVVTITGSNIPPYSALVLTLQDVGTPDSIRGGSTVSVSSFSADGLAVDDSGSLTLDAVESGALVGALTLSLSTPTPSVASVVTLRATTSGTVPIGGYIGKIDIAPLYRCIIAHTLCRNCVCRHLGSLSDGYFTSCNSNITIRSSMGLGCCTIISSSECE